MKRSKLFCLSLGLPLFVLCLACDDGGSDDGGSDDGCTSPNHEDSGAGAESGEAGPSQDAGEEGDDSSDQDDGFPDDGGPGDDSSGQDDGFPDDGGPGDDGGGIGDQCEVNGDCESNACLIGDGDDFGLCSQVCDDVFDCPSFWDCIEVDNAASNYCSP